MMTTPEAAVEAAAGAMYEMSKMEPFDGADEDDRKLFRSYAREALDAAAPHMTTSPMGMNAEEWEKYVRSYR